MVTVVAVSCCRVSCFGPHRRLQLTQQSLRSDSCMLPICRSKLAPLIARTITAIIADVEQTASRLQSSEQLLRRELQSYSKDPSAGAAQGLNSVKVCASCMIHAV